MKNKRLTQIRAGNMVSAVLYTQPMAWDEPRARAAKSKISSEARQRINHRASWQKLEGLIAENFGSHDLFCTFTYRDLDLPHSREQAVSCFKRFLTELRASRRLRGQDILYIKNVEHETDGEGRWHHHLIVNATSRDYEELRALWARYGDNVEIRQLRDFESLAALAQYMCKERQPLGRQTWTPSRNLRRPERTSELVDDSTQLAPPAGAVVIESASVENAWGSYVYLKFLVPDEPEISRPRPAPARQKRIQTSLFSVSG